MRFSWRTDATPLKSHSSWVERIEDKNRDPGTSAPTLAAVWAGPLDLLGALATHSALCNLTVQSATVEKKTSFDQYGGNVRNHDLVLRATTTSGERVIVCVEAKAGENLGETVGKQTLAAKRTKAENPRSCASARIEDLVERLCRFPKDDPRVAALRYQLLTAWAGTLSDAAEAAHAVFALHEFRTNERPDDKSAINEAELARFAKVVLGCDFPGARSIPWCIQVPDAAGVAAALYVAHVVTDIRDAAIVVPSTSPPPSQRVKPSPLHGAAGDR
jgi:hypothetical protein